MGDGRTTLTIALATVLGNGSGWQSLANVDPDVPWRAELASAALPTDQVEVWVSSDNTGPTNYVGFGTSSPTPPSGVRLVTLQGENGAFTVAPTNSGPSLYVNFVRVAGTLALNALVTGGLGNTGPSPGTYWVNGDQTGPLTGGTSDGSLVTVGGQSAAAPTSVLSGTTGAVIVNSGTTGTVNLGTGAGGVDVNAKTVNVATGAGAKTLVMGSVTGASSAELLAGSGGIGIGVAPPGASGVTIDTPAAGALLVGVTHATSLTVGGTDMTGGIAIAAGAAPNGPFADDITVNAGGSIVIAAAISASIAAEQTTVGEQGSNVSTTINGGTGASGGIILAGGVKSSYTAASAITIGSSAVIGTAAATVDLFDMMEVIASAGTLALTLPAPADTTRGHRFTVMNGGAANSFTMYGKVITTSATPQTAAGDFFWSPTLGAWLVA